MLRQIFLQKFATCLLVAGAFFVVALCVQIFRERSAGAGLLTIEVFTVAFFSAMIWTLLRRLSLAHIAAEIDTRAQTRDRFVTAFAFGQLATRTALQDSALRECRGYISRFDPRPFTRLRLPREVPWLIVPVIASILLLWHAQLAMQARKPDPRASQELAEKANELEKLAKQVEAANQTAQSDELKKIAEELRKSIAAMHERAQQNGDASKAALSELSALEAALQKMRDQNANAPELAALAEALQKANATQQAAESLRKGELDAAAAQLEAPQAREQADQVAQAMKDTNPQTNAQSQISQAMSQLAKSAESKPDAQRALQRLAEALRQSARSQSSSGAGGKASQQVLNALQDLKYGRPGNSSKLSDQLSKTAADAKAGTQIFANGNKDTEANVFDPSNPSGQPGSEHDIGTTNTPYGKENKRLNTEHTDVDLAGLLGKGESLQNLIATHGDESKATQKYRQLYNAMTPAAEDAIMQENIPLGSRFFVKRYFEKIRPKE